MNSADQTSKKYQMHNIFIYLELQSLAKSSSSQLEVLVNTC